MRGVRRRSPLCLCLVLVCSVITQTANSRAVGKKGGIQLQADTVVKVPDQTQESNGTSLKNGTSSDGGSAKVSNVTDKVSNVTDKATPEKDKDKDVSVVSAKELKEKPRFNVTELFPTQPPPIAPNKEELKATDQHEEVLREDAVIVINETNKHDGKNREKPVLHPDDKNKLNNLSKGNDKDNVKTHKIVNFDLTSNTSKKPVKIDPPRPVATDDKPDTEHGATSSVGSAAGTVNVTVNSSSVNVTVNSSSNTSTIDANNTVTHVNATDTNAISDTKNVKSNASITNNSSVTTSNTSATSHSNSTIATSHSNSTVVASTHSNITTATNTSSNADTRSVKANTVSIGNSSSSSSGANTNSNNTVS